MLYTAFALAPIVLAFYYSFYHWDGIAPLTDFIGLNNYRRAFHDPVFLESIRHNFYILFLSLAVQLPIALGVASLLNLKLRGRTLLRTIFFAPYVLSEVIAAVIWQLMLQPGALADSVLSHLGLSSLIQGWLSDPSIALWTLFVVATWKYIGFGIILLLAGLQGIPAELTEAAEVDGASRWAVFRHIKLPLLGPDDPDLGVPVDHRVAAAVRPGLHPDRWGSDQLHQHHGRLHDRPRFPPLPVRLRQRHRHRLVPALVRHFRCVPAVRASA